LAYSMFLASLDLISYDWNVWFWRGLYFIWYKLLFTWKN
jgi:hypothetical protein